MKELFKLMPLIAVNLIWYLPIRYYFFRPLSKFSSLLFVLLPACIWTLRYNDKTLLYFFLHPFGLILFPLFIFLYLYWFERTLSAWRRTLWAFLLGLNLYLLQPLIVAYFLYCVFKLWQICYGFFKNLFV
jgi:hypothetical protein